MFPKTFIVTLFLLSSKVSAEPNPRDLTNVAQQLLQELTDFIHVSTKGALYEIDRFQTLLNSTVKFISTPVINQIDDLEQLVQNITAGVEITNCVVTQTTELDNLRKTVLDDLDICGNGLLETYYKLDKVFKGQLTTTVEQVDSFQEQLNACGDDEDCVVEFIDIIDEMSKSLPQVVLYANAHILKLGDPVLAPIEGCVHKKNEQVQVEGGKIVEEIQKCINDASN